MCVCLVSSPILTFAYGAIASVAGFTGAAVPPYSVKAQRILITAVLPRHTLIML